MNSLEHDDAILHRLLRDDTAAVSDALDSLGIDGQCVGLLPVAFSARFAGRAFTVRMLPVGLSGKSVGDYIDEVPAGAVVVIDNGGREDATVWGDILTVTAVRNGVAGVVIDGVCRDTEVIHAESFPAFARGWTMRTGKDRVAAEEFGGAVQLAGVRVEPGDWLLGDRDGVVVVPASRAVDVLDKADEVSAIENRIRSGIQSGDRLADIRRAAGYHALQTRTS